MPLTAKGEEVLAAMKKEYGDKKGEEVFYAKINSGDKEAQSWHEGEKKPAKKTSHQGNTIMGGRSLAEVRKKQGPGFWGADIGE